jgi:hypothetical protein
MMTARERRVKGEQERKQEEAEGNAELMIIDQERLQRDGWTLSLKRLKN